MQEKNQAASQNPQSRKNSTVLYILLAVLFVLSSVLYLSYQDVSSKLSALYAERKEREERHEKLLGYYVDMRRKSGYYDHIKTYAKEFDVHPSFISAIIARESHYQSDAQSHVGARGLMQIMQNTGDWISKKLKTEGYSYDMLFDPALNIQYGAWYIRNLSAQFKGDPVMIAAAYHAGPRNVKLWALKYGDDKSSIRIGQIPKDNTRDYVKKVMEAYALYYEYDH